MTHAYAVGRPHAVRLGLVLLLMLLAVLLWSGVNFVSDARDLVDFPLQVDFGEGIAWEHARLLLTSKMYAPDFDVPFIAMEYPPVYYLATRALAAFGPDFLAAGRLVSSMASLASAGLIAALVWRMVRDRRADVPASVAALAAGLLFLALHATRNWGDLFRVDVLAVALGLAGTLVAARADGRFWGTCAGLLLCVAAIYTKQSALPAFLSVAVIAILRRPRPAIAAVAVAAGVAVAALVVLQLATGGGFLRNTVAYLVNPMTWDKVWHVLVAERSSLPFALAMLVAATGTAAALPRRWRSWRKQEAITAMVLLHFLLAAIMLVQLGKAGGSYNYFLDIFAVGCVLVGGMLAAWPIATAPLSIVLLLGILNLPAHQFRPGELAARAADMRPVLEKIEAAAQPVASDDIMALIRAGKPVVYESAIVGLMAGAGTWDAAPLTGLVRRHEFAFYLVVSPTELNETGSLAEAIREEYPVVEPAAPGLWYRLPRP